MIERIIIAAMTKEGRVIGKDGDLPWPHGTIKGDLPRFKRLTKKHPIIMGRKTADSFPGKKPLPNRENIVVSRGYNEPGFIVLNSLQQVNDYLITASSPQIDYSQIYIIGGAQMYREAIKTVDKLEITEVFEEYDGDTFFPEISSSTWREESRINHESGTHAYVTYVRK